MNRSIHFSCPSCLVQLNRAENKLICEWCGKKYEISNGIGIFLPEDERPYASFYDEWYHNPHIAYNTHRIGRLIKSSDFVNKHSVIFQHLLYTQYKRERFFKKVAKTIRSEFDNPLILDIGCGGGNPIIAQTGEICGIDCSMVALRNSFAHNNYKLLANGSVLSMPFENNMFDCIISSDLIGHIKYEDKERFFKEMSRVLKKGGLCAHLLETDSDNFLKKFAQKHSDLYKQYFIEGIGGHFGLEMPEIVLNRFRSFGLYPVSIRKYYTYVWDIESFIALFDNEYRDKSFVLKSVLHFYTLLCRNFKVKLTATAILGLISFLVDVAAPLSKAEGLMVICRKQ